MSENPSNFRRIVNLISVLALGSSAARASVPNRELGVVGDKSGSVRSTEFSKSPETIGPKEYKFGELWDKYFPNSLHATEPYDKGDLYDFDEYCTPFPRGCGINETDPDFDKQFHGHFYGYKAINKGGVWYYIEKDGNSTDQ